MRLTRRQLIKTGLMGSVLLVGAGYLAAPAPDPVPVQSPQPLAFLTRHHAIVIAAIAPAMLAVERLDLNLVTQGVDAAIRALPLALQAEVGQLLDLLANPWGRRWLAGLSTPWPRATRSDITAFLQRWQQSRFALLRTGYQALHALIMAAWYGNPHSWAALGYQRPAQILAVLP